MATVRYLVNDVEESVRFYVDRLGFEIRQQVGAAFALVGRGDLTLWLAGAGSSAARPMPDGRQPEPGGWNRFVIETSDIATLVSDLRAAGVPFRNDVVVGPGGSQILCEDPSGNLVELFQPA